MSPSRHPLLLLLPSLLSLVLIIQPVIGGRSKYNRDNEPSYSHDTSFPTTRIPFNPDSALHRGRVDAFRRHMSGCRYHAESTGTDASSCDDALDHRLRLNSEQPGAVEMYTFGRGFRVNTREVAEDIDEDDERVEEPDWFDDLEEYYLHQRGSVGERREEWPVGSVLANHWDFPTGMVDIYPPDGDNDDDADPNPVNWEDSIRGTVKHLQKLMRSWIPGSTIKPSLVYGVRVYHRGSVLYPHVHGESYPLCAILCIEGDKSWPLEIYDRRDGEATNVTMGAGDVVLIEGAGVVHGRPFPLEGNRFAVLMVFFEPEGHRERHAERIWGSGGIPESEEENGKESASAEEELLPYPESELEEKLEENRKEPASAEEELLPYPESELEENRKEPASAEEEPLPYPESESEENRKESASAEEEPLSYPESESEENVKEPASAEEGLFPYPEAESKENVKEPASAEEEMLPYPESESEENRKESASAGEDPLPYPEAETNENVKEPASVEEEPLPYPESESEENGKEPASAEEEPLPYPESVEHVLTAAQLGDIRTVKRYIRTALESSDENGWFAIHEAARGGHVEVLKLLLEEGMNPNQRTGHGRGASALYWAERTFVENCEVCEVLRKAGGKVILSE